MGKLLAVVAALVIVVAVVLAGFASAPSVTIAAPEKYVGISTPLDVVIAAPGGRLSSVDVEFEQGGVRTPVLALSGTDAVATDSHVTSGAGDTVRVKSAVGSETVQGLHSGAGQIVVTASRPVLLGLRHKKATLVRQVEVRLERPRVSPLSTKHYINQGGSEMVVYKVTPGDAASGVMVGEIEYPGYPASSIGVPGITISDPDVRVAFFSLLYDQDPEAPIRVFARDAAGNTGSAELDHLSFPKQFKKSTIPIDDKFLHRVVPAILEGTTEVKAGATELESFLVINSVLRKRNAERIASFAAQSAPEILWKGVVFHPFTNSAVEAAFADRRTYVYQGRDVDTQTHLGFDLASFVNTPIVAANRGRVMFADNLGIYGNCVIIDHGMGVQSLYAHLSSIGVATGAMVEKDQQIGRSGMTGLAGGDHLHFTMLVNGQMVNPLEWWDSHWIEDRILRKLRDVADAR